MRPAALLVLLAAAARAGRVRLGLLVRCWPGQCLGWVVADELLDLHEVLARKVVSLSSRQFVEPAGLLVVLGDAFAFFVTFLKCRVFLDVIDPPGADVQDVKRI